MNAPFFHIGVVVADLDAAIPRFETVFGVNFGPLSRMPARIEADDGTSYDRELKVTYSREGPPYIELVQGFDSGFLSLEGGEGVHHVGVWTPESDAVSVPDRFDLLHTDVSVDAGLMVLRHTAPTSLHGVRLEMFDDRIRSQVEAWIHG